MTEQCGSERRKGVFPIEYRVENKYLVTDLELKIIFERLRSVMPMDIHQDGNAYEIRSLYFDDYRDRCLEENDAGTDPREKYRIRIYDPHQASGRLEIKEKNRGLTRKTSCTLSRKECIALMDQSMGFSVDMRAVLNRLQLQRQCYGMRPKVIIAYERTAFVHTSGNVRITFDRNIMASCRCEQFFEETVNFMTPVLPAGLHVLEVKYDELCPDYIYDRLELGSLRQTAFSKYYLGRMAVNGEFPVD